ncbi:MAG: hypothetical protein WCE81_10860 [Halobacteriota archaeon]
MTIKDGDVVQSPRWPEPIEVNLVEELGDYARIVGVTLHSRQHIDDLILHSEFT